MENSAQVLLQFQFLNMEQGAIKTIGKYSYYTQKCLGEGSFGKVFQGYENTTKQKVAVKKVDFKTIQKDPYLERAIHEQIRILSKFKHPNIVQLMEVLNSKRSLYIIMEYCRDGDLKKYLKKRQKEGLAQSEVLVIMKQVIKGYQELARNNIIHRDLKPANILINGGYFKICDFGFSKVIKDPTVANKTCVGSPIYMAPQILDKKDYSAKCDIWSLGIIFYQLLHSVVPWTAKSQRQLLAKIKTQSFPCTRASPQSQKIIRQMLEVSEQKRVSLRDLQSFFNLQAEKLVPSKEAPMWEQQPSGMVDPPVRIQRTQQLPSNLEPSTQAKVLNRNYFQQLAWRYFVCIQLRTNLNFLNRFNFKQNIFERYIVLLISSVISSLKKKKLEIQRIHQKEAIAKIKQETQSYLQFQKDFYEFLNEGYSTCQILKEFDLIDVAASNFTEQTSKRAEIDLIKNSQVILRQLQQQAKLTQDQQQRTALLSIAQLILDMILLNEKQARTGASQVDPYLADRSVRTLDKRFTHKIMSLKQVKRTEFY